MKGFGVVKCLSSFFIKKDHVRCMPFLWLFILMHVSCQSDTLNTKQRITQNSEDKLIQINRMLVRKESDEIDAYIQKKGWKMVSTGSGLRYFILQEGKGNPIGMHENVFINYRIEDISGKLLTSTKPGNPLHLQTGRGEVPKGLEEAILLMKKGCKARLILPSHLAFGLAGSEHVKQASSVVYEVELLNN